MQQRVSLDALVDLFTTMTSSLKLIMELVDFWTVCFPVKLGDFNATVVILEGVVLSSLKSSDTVSSKFELGCSIALS